MAENYGQETMLFSTNQPEHPRQSDNFCACCRHHLRYYEIHILLLAPPGIIGSVSIIMTEVVGTNVLIFIMAMTVARNAVMRRKNIISEEALSEYLNLSYQPLANTQMIQSPPLTKPP